MADGKHVRKILSARSSNEPDYSARDALFAQLDEHDSNAEGCLMAASDPESADYYINSANAEKFSKAYLLCQTGLMAFVNKRCRQKGFVFEEKGGFVLGDDGTFNSRYSYLSINSGEEKPVEFKINMAKLRDILKNIGIPAELIETAIYYNNVTNIEGEIIQAEKEPFQYVRVAVDKTVIHGLIENAVEERFSQIVKKLDSHVPDPVEITALIARETGKDSRDFLTPSQIISEKPSETVMEGIKSDIRQKVTKELLGELAKPVETQEEMGL